MARSPARLKMGFFPLPETEARRIHSLLSFPFPCSVIDPCAGQGTAFNLTTEGVQVQRHGIELDTRRAEQAAASGIQTIRTLHAGGPSSTLPNFTKKRETRRSFDGGR